MTPEAERADALATLAAWGATPRLVRHAELVSEVALELGRALVALGAPLDLGWTVRAAAWHDAGKIWHPAELDAPGKLHEARGERELLERGVPEGLARVSRSHADFELARRDEEVVVCCADALWKGKRDPAREADLTDRVAAATGRGRWDVLVPLDDVFEAIAADADARLARS
jgi:hypothetical protein